MLKQIFSSLSPQRVHVSFCVEDLSTQLFCTVNTKYIYKSIISQEIFRKMNYSRYLIYEIGIVGSGTKRLYLLKSSHMF